MSKIEIQSEIYGGDTDFKIEHFVNSSKKVGQNAKKCPNKEVEDIKKTSPKSKKSCNT